MLKCCQSVLLGYSFLSHANHANTSFDHFSGSILSIVGFGLMFTTAGVSGLLIPIGAAIAGAGGLTTSISGFVEYGIQK